MKMTIEMPWYLWALAVFVTAVACIQFGIWLAKGMKWLWNDFPEPKWTRVVLAALVLTVIADGVCYIVYNKSDPLFMFVWGFVTSCLIWGAVMVFGQEDDPCGQCADMDKKLPCVLEKGHMGEHRNRKNYSWTS